MIESALVTAIVLVMVLVAYGGAVVKWYVLLGTGAAVVVLGLAAGMVSGSVYHLALYRALAPRNILEKGWVWHPTRYHSRIPADRRRAVLFWFRCGVACMFATLGGCLLVLAGLFAARAAL